MLYSLYSQRKSRIWRILSNWWGMNTNTSPTQAKSPSRKARRATRQSSSYAHPATCTLTPWTTVVMPTKSFRACLPSSRSMNVNEHNTMLFDDKTSRFPKRPQSSWAVCDSTRAKWVEQRRRGNEDQVTIYSRLSLRASVLQMLCLFVSTLLINNCN